MILCAVPVGAAGPDAYEARRATCEGWMLTAYPSGLEEVACTAEFGLPSPFLFKCARAQHQGFASATQREACRLAFLKAARAAADGHVLN